MAWARAVRIVRLTLQAGVLTPVAPPNPMEKCMVANGTGGDLEIHTNEDLTEYRVLTSGFERLVEAHKLQGFLNDNTAFWLRSAGGGLVILEWS